MINIFIKTFRQMLAALQLLTIIPLKIDLKIRDEELGELMGYFPLIGFFLGFLLVLINWFFRGVLPESIINLMLIAFLVLITGAMHLDGFADTLDGFGAGRDKEERLRIMRDTTLGVFAVAGVVFLILFKFLVLNNFPRGVKDTYLLIFPLISRLAMVQIAFLCKYARADGGLGKPFIDSERKREFFLATFVGLFITIGVMGQKGILLMIVVLSFVGIFSIYTTKKIGGITGDVLGATNEISELLILFCGMILESGANIGILDKLGI